MCGAGPGQKGVAQGATARKRPATRARQARAPSGRHPRGRSRRSTVTARAPLGQPVLGAGDDVGGSGRGPGPAPGLPRGRLQRLPGDVSVSGNRCPCLPRQCRTVMRTGDCHRSRVGHSSPCRAHPSYGADTRVAHHAQCTQHGPVGNAGPPGSATSSTNMAGKVARYSKARAGSHEAQLRPAAALDAVPVAGAGHAGLLLTVWWSVPHLCRPGRPWHSRVRREVQQSLRESNRRWSTCMAGFGWVLPSNARLRSVPGRGRASVPRSAAQPGASNSQEWEARRRRRRGSRGLCRARGSPTCVLLGGGVRLAGYAWTGAQRVRQMH